MKVDINFIDVEEVIFKDEFKKFIEDIVKEEEKKLGEIYFIFTTNKNILEINRRFLNHDYFTDVITFDNSKRNSLSGDIYVSIDQVYINAKNYKCSFKDEIARVIIHGLLHLIGYNDKTEKEIILMRQKEDGYLWRFKKYDLIAESET